MISRRRHVSGDDEAMESPTDIRHVYQIKCSLTVQVSTLLFVQSNLTVETLEMGRIQGTSNCRMEMTNKAIVPPSSYLRIKLIKRQVLVFREPMVQMGRSFTARMLPWPWDAMNFVTSLSTSFSKDTRLVVDLVQYDTDICFCLSNGVQICGASLFLVHESFREWNVDYRFHFQISYRLSDCVVHHRFVKEGRASITVVDQKLDILLSNSAPDKLNVFIKTLQAKLKLTKKG